MFLIVVGADQVRDATRMSSLVFFNFFNSDLTMLQILLVTQRMGRSYVSCKRGEMHDGARSHAGIKSKINLADSFSLKW